MYYLSNFKPPTPTPWVPEPFLCKEVGSLELGMETWWVRTPSPLFPFSRSWTTMPTLRSSSSRYQSSSSPSSASSPLRRAVAGGRRSVSAASSSSGSVAVPCDDGDSKQTSEGWVELVRNASSSGFSHFHFPNEQTGNTCDCEMLGDAVLVQNCDPHLPPALLVAFLLP